MSTIDLSRLINDPRKHYAGVRHQQGRVLTDEDFNEAAIIEAEELRRTRIHAIGAYGAPGPGFLPSGFTTSGGKLDFTLGAGELYLGGLRLEMSSPEQFLEQRDWLNFDKTAAPSPPAANTTRTDLVWIEAWQQPVTATEDGELFEVALGGPDTSTRWRTMRRVHVLQGVAGDECPAAWAAAQASFAGMGTMDGEMKIATSATLTVSFTAAAVPGDLCSPPTAGGYLGAENQAIRVQMVDATHYTWGYDNAAPLHRAVVTSRAGQPVVVTLKAPPRDAAHWPLRDQVVELLPWSAALPNGEPVADLSGHLCKVAVSYDPDSLSFEIDVPLPAGFDRWKSRSDAAEFTEEFVYLRVWNRGDDLASPAKIPIASTTLGNTGLGIAFGGGPLRPEDHWIIAARPAAPDAVTPWRLTLPSGAPPNGVDRYRAPIGLVEWTGNANGAATGELIDDCRPPFLPLTRIRGCCSVTVGDNVISYGMFSSIADALASLPPTGGTVCILPGTYREAVRIEGRRNITLHGCGPRSRIYAPDKEGEKSSAVTITDSTDICVEGLAIEGGGEAVVRIEKSDVVRIADCLVQFRDIRESFSAWPAIYADGENIDIDGNIIEPAPDDEAGGLHRIFSKLAAPGRAGLADAARGGIQIGGGSDTVRIADNVIAGGRGNGITLGSILRIDEEHPDGIEVVDIDIEDPCAPCAPTDHGSEDDGEEGDGQVHYESAGDLYDIEISGNVISRHGANGIAVVRFFGLRGGGLPLVSVHGLTIADNRIIGCLRHEIAAPTSQLMQLLLGYGGIALAFTTELVIEGNRIEDNGLNWRDPICGIFVLVADGLQIEHNLVRGNGAPDVGRIEGARNGIRAGIHVWLALSLGKPGKYAGEMMSAATRRSLAHGVDQLRVHANQVEHPLGRALFMLGAGPMLITDNRFASEALADAVTDRFARTVLVGNLGVGRDWTIGLLYALLYRILAMMGYENIARYVCPMAKLGALTKGVNPLLPTGKTQFDNNQISFNMDDPEQGFDLSSVLLLSLDDVSACDNQFEYHIRAERRRLALADLVAAGMTVRTNDNRLSETWGRAFFSILSLGLLNTAADNQSTHCIRVLGLKTAADNNLVLGEIFCEDLCSSGGRDDVTGDLASGAGRIVGLRA